MTGLLQRVTFFKAKIIFHLNEFKYLKIVINVQKSSLAGIYGNKSWYRTFFKDKLRHYSTPLMAGRISFKKIMKKLLKFFNSLAEVPRGFAEWGALQAYWSKIKAGTPKGDGHDVLILPGFMTGDTYTAPLRTCLVEKGYKVHTWDGGLNLGLSEKTADHLQDHIEKIFAQNGGRKITLIGHSLGGIYARELAREYSEMVRAVITLGTPFGVGGKEDATPQALRQLYAFLNPGTDQLDNADFHKKCLTPPPVPTTSIYSKSDGIVDWEASLNPVAAQTENIEVYSSHLGIIVNPLAVAVVLDRLAQEEGKWTPLKPDMYKDFGVSAANATPDADKVPDNPFWNEKNSKPVFRKKK